MLHWMDICWYNVNSTHSNAARSVLCLRANVDFVSCFQASRMRNVLASHHETVYCVEPLTGIMAKVLINALHSCENKIEEGVQEDELISFLKRGTFEWNEHCFALLWASLRKWIQSLFLKLLNESTMRIAEGTLFHYWIPYTANDIE